MTMEAGTVTHLISCVSCVNEINSRTLEIQTNKLKPDELLMIVTTNHSADPPALLELSTMSSISPWMYNSKQRSVEYKKSHLHVDSLRGQEYTVVTA